MNIELEVIAVLFNFICVVGILVHFGRKPAKDFLAHRSQTIATQIKEATELSKNAQRELAEWQQRWSESESLAKRDHEDAKKSVEKFRETVLAHAKTEAQRIQHEAKLVGESEASKAQQGLRKELIHTSVRVARDYLAQNLEDRDKLHLVTEYLETIPNGQAG